MTTITLKKSPLMKLETDDILIMECIIWLTIKMKRQIVKVLSRLECNTLAELAELWEFNKNGKPVKHTIYEDNGEDIIFDKFDNEGNPIFDIEQSRSLGSNNRIVCEKWEYDTNITTHTINIINEDKDWEYEKIIFKYSKGKLIERIDQHTGVIEKWEYDNFDNLIFWNNTSSNEWRKWKYDIHGILEEYNDSREKYVNITSKENEIIIDCNVDDISMLDYYD